jgi:hypothetical protein
MPDEETRVALYIHKEHRKANLIPKLRALAEERSQSLSEMVWNILGAYVEERDAALKEDAPDA